MPEQEYDQYETVEAGGLPDDFDGLISEAKFTYDSEYADGTQLIMKVVLTTDAEDPSGTPIKDRDGTVGQQTQFYSVGKGWEQDGPKGERAVREDATKKPQFTNNSGIGLLLDGALGAGALDVMRSRGLPSEAATWVGLEFHWERKDHDYGGTIGKKPRLVPTAFLGVRGVDGALTGGGGHKNQGAATKAAQEPKAAAPAAAAPAAAAPAAVKLSGRLKAQLTTMAAEYTEDQREAFVAAALELDGVKGVDAAETAVMASGDGSIWTEAHS